MPNLEVLVSPQDLIALRSIYGCQKHIEESFYCNKITGELEDRQWQNILFLFLFHLLCNSLKCMGHYDSKGVCKIIQVDKY